MPEVDQLLEFTLDARREQHRRSALAEALQRGASRAVLLQPCLQGAEWLIALQVYASA